MRHKAVVDKDIESERDATEEWAKRRQAVCEAGRLAACLDIILTHHLCNFNGRLADLLPEACMQQLLTTAAEAAAAVDNSGGGGGEN